MLSIEELRQILGQPDLSDEYLEQLRDDLYCFARVLIEGYIRERQERASRIRR